MSASVQCVEQMVTLAKALDNAKVDLIEVTHGDGLGGASVNYGFPKNSDQEYLQAVIPEMKHAKISALLLPGIGTVKHLEMAHDCGINTIRVATHCTEADVSEQHIVHARKLELDTVGFLMMAHMIPGEKLLAQAKLMVAYGANCVYITDSAGYLLPEGARERVGALRQGLPSEIEIGFHGHHNLAMGVANSIAAVEEGACRRRSHNIQIAGMFGEIITATFHLQKHTHSVAVKHRTVFDSISRNILLD